MINFLKKTWKWIVALIAIAVPTAYAATTLLPTQCNPVDTKITATVIDSAIVDTKDISDKEMFTKSFSCGTYESIVDIPDDANRMIVILSRENWEEKGLGENVISVESDYFNGKEWSLNSGIGGFTTDGGLRYLQDGKTLATESYNDSPIPEGVGRKIRARVLSKIDLNSTVSFKFYSVK